MTLSHEVPTALGTRPMLVVRSVPGVVLRLPMRAAIILLAAALLAGALIGIVGAPWVTAPVVLIPAVGVALLVEIRPGGKPPLHWLLIRARHASQAAQLAAHPISRRGRS